MQYLRNVSIILILLGYGYSSIAQPAGEQLLLQIEELRLSISKSDGRKLDKVKENIDEAYQLMQNARTKSNRGEAMQMLQKAQQAFNEAITISNAVFSEYIDKFYDDLNPSYRDDLARAKHFEYKSEDYLEKAGNYQDTARTTSDYITTYNSLTRAFEYKALAIINQARALRIYQDFPVEYPYVWDDYIKPRLLVEREARVFKQDTVVEKEVADLTPKDEIIKDTVFFRVQIAAHTIPISSGEIKDIYSGNMEVRVLKEDGWYKYQIGNYLDYEEAHAILKKCNVKKAFIVAYNSHGEKLVVTEVTGQPQTSN